MVLREVEDIIKQEVLRMEKETNKIEFELKDDDLESIEQ